MSKSLYDEKFAQSIPLFRDKPNGNFRMKLILSKPEDAKLNLIRISQQKVNIRIIGNRSCFKCGSISHLKAQCMEPPSVDEKQVSHDSEAQPLDPLNH